MDAKTAVIIVMIVVVVFLVMNKMTSNYSSEIPKIIWTYWDSTEKPETVRRCMDSWKKFNPDYDIRVISKENLSRYTQTDILELKLNDSPSRTADFIRLDVLSQYGGIWSDASVLMTRDLGWVHDIQKSKGCEVVGYYIDGSIPKWPVMEGWFFACVPKSSYVKMWRDEFFRMNEFDSVDAYLESLDRDGDVQRIFNHRNYLAMTSANQRVMQKHMSDEEISQKLHLMDARTGPLKYLEDHGWNAESSIDNLCKKNKEELPSLIKFTNKERSYIEKSGDAKCVFKYADV